MASPESPFAEPPCRTIADFRAHTRAHNELLEWCSTRHAQLNPTLNAVRRFAADAGTGDDGPLRGVPLTVKDNMGVDGFDTWAGSTAALPERWNQSGELVQRLRAAGAVVTSKSHCAEFAFGGSGYNPHHGTPKNPWDKHIHRAPGGSSSGTAVAVASGMAWFGIGTDTGGSVRVPASLCGCVGYRPTHGKWPTDGILPLSPLFDDPGVIARNTTDLSLIVSAIDRVNPRRPLALEGQRFGLMPASYLAECEPDVFAAWTRAIALIEHHGGERVLQPEDELRAGFDMLDQGPNTAAVSCAQFIQRELPQWRGTLGPHVARLLAEHSDVSTDKVEERHQRVLSLRDQQEALFGHADFLLCPTCPVGAPAVAMLSSEQYYDRYSNALLRFTVLPSLFGCCALSLPMGLDKHGIPIGLQLIGRDGDDERLIACARALEHALSPAAPMLDQLFCQSS